VQLPSVGGMMGVDKEGEGEEEGEEEDEDEDVIEEGEEGEEGGDSDVDLVELMNQGGGVSRGGVTRGVVPGGASLPPKYPPPNYGSVKVGHRGVGNWAEDGEEEGTAGVELHVLDEAVEDDDAARKVTIVCSLLTL
jgi:hypothetical protein